jgi:hypothetical protein
MNIRRLELFYQVVAAMGAALPRWILSQFMRAKRVRTVVFMMRVELGAVAGG